MINDKKYVEISQRLFSSAIGALVTSVIVTPLDVIKIRIQIQHKPLLSGECFNYCNNIINHVCQCVNGSEFNTNTFQRYKKSEHYRNSLHAFKKIVATEGVTSLWSGLSPTLIMAVPQVVIYYTLNDWLKSISGYSHFQKSTSTFTNNINRFTKYDLVPPICGVVSRFTAQIVIAPLELIRTKMQSKNLNYAEMKHITYTSLKQGGWTILWRGTGPTMWRDMSYTFTLWSIYEYLKKQHLRSFPSDDGSIHYHFNFIYSGIGAFVAGFISHPFDVTKTHSQTELGSVHCRNTKTISSTWIYLMTLKNKQGYSSLFSGFYPRIIRVIVATSMMITMFESLKTFFIRYNRRYEPEIECVYQ